MRNSTKKLLTKVGFSAEVEKVEKGLCPFCSCSISVDSFKDELSVREFRISGLCQKCQDEFFGES